MKSIRRGNIPDELYKSCVILYGAGITGKRVLELLKPYNIKIDYIVDDDMNKWGTRIENIEIISYQRLEQICTDADTDTVSVIMATIYGKTVLGKLNRMRHVYVCEMYDWLDEIYKLNTLTVGMDDRGEIDKFGRQINKIKDMVSDNESRKVIEGIYDFMRFGTQGLLAAICTEYEQYFIPEVLSAVKKPVNIVDGGAYTGDLYQSIEKYNIQLAHWYCFEADSDNYKLLLKQSEKLGLTGIQICINKGLWDKEETLYFDGEKNTVSRIVDYKTNNKIESISLDSYFRDKRCDFIKMDIEGAEYHALQGAMKVIRRDRPVLAISIYHRVEDYYKIPNYLNSELQKYKFYIRHHALILSETVLYAIPCELI